MANRNAACERCPVSKRKSGCGWWLSDGPCGHPKHRDDWAIEDAAVKENLTVRKENNE